MKIQNSLRAAGLKATPQRRAVFETMQRLGHATLDGLVEELLIQQKGMNLSTLYRVLETFTQNGILTKVEHPDGKCYYDSTQEPHAHILKEDASIEDYKDDELMRIVSQRIKEQLAPGDEIAHISIQITVKTKK